jgi:hypothetical protein
LHSTFRRVFGTAIREATALGEGAIATMTTS